MALSITGFVLAPVRVGSSNSPFTLTPDGYVSDQAAFETAYPSTESVPRTEYLVQVLSEATGSGTGPVVRDLDGTPRSKVVLPDAVFGWTKNEGAIQGGLQVPFARFGYADRDGRFKTLPGAPRELVGALSLSANATRLVVAAPVLSDLGTFPIRVAVGASGSGTTFPVALVSGVFGAPAVGTVEIHTTTGALNWNASDLTTFEGALVHFQRQAFYSPEDSNGDVGVVGGLLVLSPLPAPGQYPALKIGERGYLTPIERANEAAFLPTSTEGTVQWARDTGRLQLNTTDSAAFAGQPVFYEGVFLRAFQVPTQPIGLAQATPAGILTMFGPEGSDLYFRIPNVVQFPTTLFVDSFTSGTAGQVQVRRSDGAVQLSSMDRVTYTGLSVQAVSPDIEMEVGGSNRGVVIRLFRSLVDPGATDPTVKDVTALYGQEGATLADPIVGQPFVTLPALPLENQNLVVSVEQGTGSFTGALQRLDVAGAPAGKGYLINLDDRQLAYAERNVAEVLPTPLFNFATTQLPNAPVYPTGLVIELEAAPEPELGSNTYQTLIENQDFVIDLGSGVVTYTETSGRIIVSGTAVSASGSVLTVAEDLAGVQAGDLLLMESSEGLYSILTVPTSSTVTVSPAFSATASNAPYEIRRGKEILVDRFFRDIPPIDPNTSVERGSRELTLGVEYAVQPALGFIEFADRLLEGEELYLRYTVLDAVGNEVPVEERAAFLVAKEVTQPHPQPTSVLTFNPDGREVAAVPAPLAFRGGRPQSSAQVQFDIAASSVTFLSDDQVTDALPHGSTIGPDETVYIDYYVHEAVGGEKNLTVAQPPMATAQIRIRTEDEDGNPLSSFTLKGDRTADFAADSLLRVAGTEVYFLAASTFDGTLTTVNLAQSPSQVFRSDLTNPSLEITSGATRRVAVDASLLAYFTLEEAAYDIIARGSKQIKLQGDLSRLYVGGTVVCLTDALTYQEYSLVEGSNYDVALDRTIVVMATGVLRQHATSTLSRSIRPVLDSATGSVTTARSPLLTLPFQAYRQVEGQAGVLLTRGVDYTLDDSGVFSFVEPLHLNEEMGLFYTGARFVEAGRRTRASWTFTLVPSIGNGLLNQVLKMDYSTYAPDTFFFRVETMTNFRGEVVEQFRTDATASSPSQGPTLENSSEARLFEKGAPGLYFIERDLANQDLIARATLEYYNDLINSLEDWLQDWDGRVVGDHDGRFLFDGLIDNLVQSSFAAATNQIDDRIKIKSRTRKAFDASPYSRFYPTRRARYGVTDDPSTLVTGGPILDLGESALRQVTSVKNRSPWAVVTRGTTATGSTLEVDHAQGDVVLLRPGLDVVAGLQVAITDRDGTVIVPDGAPVAVSSTTATSVTFAAPVPAVPQGATIRMATTDTTYRKNYLVGFDVGVDLDDGFLTYIAPDDAPPNPPFPPNSSPAAGTPLDVLCTVGATDTSPERFPALDGGTTDDDGNRQFPILSVDPHSELLSLGRELDRINAATGTLRVVTTDSLTGAGTISSNGTILTNGTGAWSSPIPKVGDLVRLLTSSQGSSYFHRISVVGASSITVEPAFSAATGAAGFEITSGVPLVSSSSGTLVTATMLIDISGNFIARAVKPGHTIVVTTGTFVGQRRQVVSVVSAIQLTTTAFTGTGPVTYQVVDSLATFGGTNSLQVGWDSDLSEELRALEGQDFIDLSSLIVQEAVTQTLTVTGVAMGASDALVAFVALDNNSSGSLAITAATFNGLPLTLQLGANTPSGSHLGLFVYTMTGVSGITGNLVITATNTNVSLKLFALKLSSIKSLSVVAGITSIVPTTIQPSTTITSHEAGDLVLSFGCSRVTSNQLYPVEDHNTLIPQFNGSGTTAILRATRATSANQAITSSYRVVGTSGTARMAVVVISKDVAADTITGRAPSEKAALEAFFDLVVPDRGLGDLIGSITNATTIVGDFSGVASGDVLYIRHGVNAGVYTVETATDTSATLAESDDFPASPQTNVMFRAGDLRLPAIEVLQQVFQILKDVEAAIVSAGIIELQQRCPLLVYRNGTPAGDLPGTTDSLFTSTSGVLTATGARARPIPALATRAAFATARSSITAVTTLDAVLGPTDKLYDGRYAWIDSRINLETGLLPRAARAVSNRQRALAVTLANLTRLLAV